MLKNTANLLNLQNLMKRDPQSYLEEFRQQQRHFSANLQIFQSAMLSSAAAGTPANTSAASSALGQQTGTGGAKQHKFHKDFGGLVTFLAHVSPCFKQESTLYSGQLLELLTQHYEVLDPPLRKTIVQAVILLQNRGLIERMTLLPILFQLFKIQDKPLRQLLFHHIISDIKRINLKKLPGYLRVNTQLQNYMYTMLSDKTSPLAAKKSLDVMIDLWRRKIWNDEKTVHAIQNASFSKDTKIKVTSLRFFLGMTFYEEEEEEEEEEEKQTIRAKLSVSKGSLKGVVKKRKKAEREMKRAQKKMNKEDGKQSGSSVIDDCPAIFLLHDPQSYAERLFTMVKNSNESFQVRMLIMNVISRLIGSHRLVVLNFYPFLQKYMQPHQKNVTHILTYLAQSSHPLVPPDVLQPCIKTLANHFVNDRSSSEVTAVGLNAIREICARAPLVMDSELLWDLVAYKKDKNKGVMMASRSIIALFRDINPTLLKRKERGKFAAEFDDTGLEFGFEKVRTDIVGADLLQQINQAKEEGGEGKKGKQSSLMPDEDEWDLSAGKGSDDDDDDDNQDLGTNTKEINAFLRHVAQEDEDEEMADGEGEEKKFTSSINKKSNSKKRVSKDDGDDEMAVDVDDEDESDEECEDGELEECEDEDDGDDGDESGEGEDEEDESEPEDDETKPSEPPAKKRKVNGGESVAVEADGEDESKEESKSSLPLGALKIFTPRDFELMKQARLNQAMNRGQKRSRNSREDGSTLLSGHYDIEEGEDDDGSLVKQRQRRDVVGDVVNETSIVGWRKVLRKTKAERMETIHASRADGINSRKKGGGTTNEDKDKAKPFMLTKHSRAVQVKKGRSFSQQQQTFTKHIKNIKHSAKKIKNKMKKRKSHKASGSG